MQTNLTITSWQANYEGFELKWVWYPSKNLDAKALQIFMRDVDMVNQAYGTLHYGYFDPNNSEQAKMDFLGRTIWCIIYEGREPIGFIYNYDLGLVKDQRVIHLGLVKINKNIGKDYIKVPYIGMALGNLINFGPHFATNVSHLPIIVDMFTWLCHDVYPGFETQDSAIRNEYQPVLNQLIKNYLVSVLKYNEESVCRRTFTVRGSLANPGEGFNTDWRTIPKSNTFLCNVFVKEWLTIKADSSGKMLIQDDLIQIGKVDYRAIGEKRIHPVLSQLKFEQPKFQNRLAEIKNIFWPSTKKAS